VDKRTARVPGPDGEARRLQPVFKEGGTVTAGNDARSKTARRLLVMSERRRARWAEVRAPDRGLDGRAIRPEIMGLGPIPAIEN